MQTIPYAFTLELHRAWWKPWERKLSCGVRIDSDYLWTMYFLYGSHVGQRVNVTISSAPLDPFVCLEVDRFMRNCDLPDPLFIHVGETVWISAIFPRWGTHRLQLVMSGRKYEQ